MLRSLFGVFLLCVWSLPAHAEPCRVGELVRLVGDVQVVRSDRQFRPFLGQQVCRGDRFVTGEASIVELRLRDGSLVTVGKRSDFTVRDYRLYRERPNQALFELASGAFRSVTGTITRRTARYEVRTPVATIGVRGTDFWGGFGVTPDGLDVIMLEGKGVYVTNAQGTVELDRAGLGTTVLPGRAPAAPDAWSQEKLGRAVATITP
ncbi:MAG: FecR domain-containing protein [Moraxellaceae bacterium]